MPKPIQRVCVLAVSLLAFGSTANAENITGDRVSLRALDKVTAATQDFTVPVGETLQFGNLDVIVRHCERKPPEDTPETFVFLQIRDNGVSAPDLQSTEPVDLPFVFSGWMFGSNPALSALDHPVYDVWPLDCLSDPKPDERLDAGLSEN